MVCVLGGRGRGEGSGQAENGWWGASGPVSTLWNQERITEAAPLLPSESPYLPMKYRPAVGAPGLMEEAALSSLHTHTDTRTRRPECGN